jgi:5-methylcytosine-specific restriction protein A
MDETRTGIAMPYLERIKGPKYPKAKETASRGKTPEEVKYYGSGYWKRRSEAVRVRDKRRCQECLRNGDPTVYGINVDHKIPRRQGGTDDDENLECLCDTCHARKSRRERTTQNR